MCTPDDLECGTLGVLVDRYGDPTEGAPEMLAAARAGVASDPDDAQALIHASRCSPPLQVLVREWRGCVRSGPFDADGAGA